MVHSKAKYQTLPWLIIAFIGVAYTFMGFYMPPLGDDLGFFYNFAEQNDCWYALPRSMYRHWIWNNARMADMLNPICFNFMPQWLCALCNGTITSAMFYIAIKLCGKPLKPPYFSEILIIALIAYTFRWDAIWMEYCTAYNYVWGAAFALLALTLVLKKPEKSNAWYWWLSLPFCFVATAMHEASGVPLTLSLILFTILTGFYKRQSHAGRFMILALIAGGVFTLTSPAAYSRVGSMLQPEPPLEMLITSAGYVLILVGFIVYLFLRNRTLLKKLIRSPWIIFSVSALISTGFMLLSQYGGRTGWYVQIYALIAIFKILSELKISVSQKITVPLSVILSITIIFHYSMLAIWQKELGTEAREAIDLYKKSPDGIIYMDYTNEPELPWYLLRKTHGVPDDDDTYYRYRMTKHYGHGKPLVILPIKAKNIDWQNMAGRLQIGNQFITSQPIPGSHVDRIVDIFPRIMIHIGDMEYIETPFQIHNNSFYLYSPVDRDKGEK